jgi:hypothetical protein
MIMLGGETTMPGDPFLTTTWSRYLVLAIITHAVKKKKKKQGTSVDL